MKFYLSEESIKSITSGSLEERITQVHESLRRYHQGDDVKRKVLATFEYGAVVAEDSGTVFSYRLDRVDGSLVVTRRDPLAVPLVSEADHMARSVLSGETLAVSACQDIEEAVLERIQSVLKASPFAKWLKTNHRIIESLSEKMAPKTDLVVEQVLAEACSKLSSFRPEFINLTFWVGKLPKSMSEAGKTGETYQALVEYIKKIETFISLEIK